MPVHVSSTIVLLIIRMSKLYYTASGIITPVGGRLVHRCSVVVFGLNIGTTLEVYYILRVVCSSVVCARGTC
jgi:hypothetical protein